MPVTAMSLPLERVDANIFRLTPFQLDQDARHSRRAHEEA